MRVVSFVLLLVTLAVLGACASEEVKTEPDAAPFTVTETVVAGETGETEETATEETTTEETTDEDVARVGDSITLAGFESGFQVTLVKVKNNPPYEQYFGPSRGKRYYAVYLKINVTDGSPAQVCAGNDSSLVDNQNQTYTSAIDVVEPPFGCPRIAVGKERAGWVTFEVAKKAKLTTFVYTPDSGFADESGEWQLGG